LQDGEIVFSYTVPGTERGKRKILLQETSEPWVCIFLKTAHFPQDTPKALLARAFALYQNWIHDLSKVIPFDTIWRLIKHK